MKLSMFQKPVILACGAILGSLACSQDLEIYSCTVQPLSSFAKVGVSQISYMNLQQIADLNLIGQNSEMITNMNKVGALEYLIKDGCTPFFSFSFISDLTQSDYRTSVSFLKDVRINLPTNDRYYNGYVIICSSEEFVPRFIKRVVVYEDGYDPYSWQDTSPLIDKLEKVLAKRIESVGKSRSVATQSSSSSDGDDQSVVELAKLMEQKVYISDAAVTSSDDNQSLNIKALDQLKELKARVSANTIAAFDANSITFFLLKEPTMENEGELSVVKLSKEIYLDLVK